MKVSLGGAVVTEKWMQTEFYTPPHPLSLPPRCSATSPTPSLVSCHVFFLNLLIKKHCGDVMLLRKIRISCLSEADYKALVNKMLNESYISCLHKSLNKLNVLTHRQFSTVSTDVCLHSGRMFRMPKVNVISHKTILSLPIASLK